MTLVYRQTLLPISKYSRQSAAEHKPAVRNEPRLSITKEDPEPVYTIMSKKPMPAKYVRAGFREMTSGDHKPAAAGSNQLR